MVDTSVDFAVESSIIPHSLSHRILKLTGLFELVYSLLAMKSSWVGFWKGDLSLAGVFFAGVLLSLLGT